MLDIGTPKNIYDYLELQNLYNELLDLEKNFESKEFSIACVGIYNSGKSTLLNALIDDVDNATFKVGVIRTTAQEQSFKRESLLFLDTPGLDHNNEDMQKTKNSIQRADVIMFCHNIATGEFDRLEVEFLHFLALDDSLKNKILFVLTQKSQIEHEKINSTLVKISNQLKNNFGIISPTIIPVCSHNYQKGLRENKELLLKNSDIVLLRNELIFLKERNTNSLKQSRSGKIKAKTDEIIELLEQKRKALRCELKTVQRSYENRQKEIENDSRQLIAIVAQKHREYLKILNGV